MTEDLPSEPDTDAGRYPVFVDDTGRRRRWARIAGWCAGVLAASYVALFVLSLASSPTLLPLTLPGIGRLLPNASAPDIRVPGQGRQHVSTVVATSTPAPAPVPSRSSTPSGSTASPSPLASAVPRSSTHPTAKPTAIPSAAPTSTPTTQPSATVRPTPRGTGKPTAQPTSAHGHSPTARPHAGRP